jgi:hypothetical protein
VKIIKIILRKLFKIKELFFQKKHCPAGTNRKKLDPLNVTASVTHTDRLTEGSS